MLKHNDIEYCNCGGAARQVALFGDLKVFCTADADVKKPELVVKPQHASDATLEAVSALDAEPTGKQAKRNRSKHSKVDYIPTRTTRARNKPI